MQYQKVQHRRPSLRHARITYHTERRICQATNGSFFGHCPALLQHMISPRRTFLNQVMANVSVSFCNLIRLAQGESRRMSSIQYSRPLRDHDAMRPQLEPRCQECGFNNQEVPASASTRRIFIHCGHGSDTVSWPCM